MAISNMKADLSYSIQKVWDVVTSLENFQWRSDLSKIEIPKRVIEIKKNAFLYCYKLPDITLGYSVKAIGEDAFSCCSFLRFSSLAGLTGDMGFAMMAPIVSSMFRSISSSRF